MLKEDVPQLLNLESFQNYNLNNVYNNNINNNNTINNNDKQKLTDLNISLDINKNKLELNSKYLI